MNSGKNYNVIVTVTYEVIVQAHNEINAEQIALDLKIEEQTLFDVSVTVCKNKDSDVLWL